ncbi:MAG: hypothetical protein AAF566_07875 [Pseudomonadota bacterium]
MPTAASVDVEFSIHVAAGGQAAILDTVFSASDGTSTQFETAEITPSEGSCLAVFIDVRQASSLVTFGLLTHGAAGRTFGTGTAFPAALIADLQGITTHALYVLPDMAAAPITLQMEVSSGSTRSQVITVVEVVGALASQDGAWALNKGGAANTSLALDLTTLNSNSVVIYHIAKDFADGEPVSITGATALGSGDTGETSQFNDLQFATAFEEVAAPGSAGASASWTTGENVIGSAIEIRR